MNIDIEKSTSQSVANATPSKAFYDLPECLVTSHRLGDHMKILRVGLELTNAKLEVLSEVAKVWDMDLRELIEECVDEHIRGVLEGSGDTGKALNKILANTWLEEMGEGPDDNQDEEKELD